MTTSEAHVSDPGDPAPNPNATPEQIEAARNDPKLANVLYHDWEAGSYDEKWSISYDERCIDYAGGRFELVAGRPQDVLNWLAGCGDAAAISPSPAKELTP